MSVISSRTIQLQFRGDITSALVLSALDNIVSPGMEVIQSLNPGNNTISAPVVSGIVVTGLTIIPPSGNTVLMTLAGIPLHLTDPVSLSLDISFVSLVINAVTAIIGVRFIWS